VLIVKTYIARSAINGYGVFAYELIPAGTLVWQFTPGVDLELSAEQMDCLPAPARQYLRHFASQTGPDTFLLCADSARFMNHCDRPNISSADERNYALKDIAPGEEIVCNYGEFVISFTGF
jgi:SET domain-containing protein